jgi:hypothetical protein
MKLFRSLLFVGILNACIFAFPSGNGTIDSPYVFNVNDFEYVKIEPGEAVYFQIRVNNFNGVFNVKFSPTWQGLSLQLLYKDFDAVLDVYDGLWGPKNGSWVMVDDDSGYNNFPSDIQWICQGDVKLGTFRLRAYNPERRGECLIQVVPETTY